VHIEVKYLKSYIDSMKQGRNQSYDPHLPRDGPYEHHVNNYDAPEEVYGKDYKLIKKSRSVSEDSDEIVYTPKNKVNYFFYNKVLVFNCMVSFLGNKSILRSTLVCTILLHNIQL